MRLNTTASNLANAGSVSGSRAKAPSARCGRCSATVEDGPGRRHRRASTASSAPTSSRPAATTPIIRSPTPNGDVWEAGVDSAAELIEMVETARQYQNNVQVLQTAKTLTLDTLRLGQ